MKRRQRRIIETRVATAEANLAEARARPDLDRKGARRDFDPQPPVITGGDLVEGDAMIGDEPGEDVDTAGRALGIGRSGHRVGQGKGLKNGNEIDATGLQNRAGTEIEFVQGEIVELVLDRGAAARQKACPKPVGDRPQAQVEAGRLDLVGIQRSRRRDGAGVEQLADAMGGKNAGDLGHGRAKRPESNIRGRRRKARPDFPKL